MESATAAFVGALFCVQEWSIAGLLRKKHYDYLG